MLGLDDTEAADHRRAARSGLHALQRALSRAHPRFRRRLLCRHPAKGHHRPPSLRELRRRRAVHAAGGARPGRGGDQADALSHQRGQPDRARARRSRRGRQIGDRAGRAQGAVRRGGQYPLGARSGTRRRAGGLRISAAEDPRQGVAGRAPRRRPALLLRPFRHRQLPPLHGQGLHRSVVFHLRSGAVPRRGATVQLHDRLCDAGQPREDLGRADQSAGPAVRVDRGRDRQCAARASRRRSGPR